MDVVDVELPGVQSVLCFVVPIEEHYVGQAGDRHFLEDFVAVEITNADFQNIAQAESGHGLGEPPKHVLEVQRRVVVEELYSEQKEPAGSQDFLVEVVERDPRVARRGRVVGFGLGLLEDFQAPGLGRVDEAPHALRGQARGLVLGHDAVDGRGEGQVQQSRRVLSVDAHDVHQVLGGAAGAARAQIGEDGTDVGVLSGHRPEAVEDSPAGFQEQDQGRLRLAEELAKGLVGQVHHSRKPVARHKLAQLADAPKLQIVGRVVLFVEVEADQAVFG